MSFIRIDLWSIRKRIVNAAIQLDRKKIFKIILEKQAEQTNDE